LYFEVNPTAFLVTIYVVNIDSKTASEQVRPKAYPATQSASPKSLGDKNKEVGGTKLTFYLFVLIENKRTLKFNALIFHLKQKGKK